MMNFKFIGKQIRTKSIRIDMNTSPSSPGENWTTEITPGSESHHVGRQQKITARRYGQQVFPQVECEVPVVSQQKRMPDGALEKHLTYS